MLSFSRVIFSTHETPFKIHVSASGILVWMVWIAQGHSPGLQIAFERDRGPSACACVRPAARTVDRALAADHCAGAGTGVENARHISTVL